MASFRAANTGSVERNALPPPLHSRCLEVSNSPGSGLCKLAPLHDAYWAIRSSSIAFSGDSAQGAIDDAPEGVVSPLKKCIELMARLEQHTPPDPFPPLWLWSVWVGDDAPALNSLACCCKCFAHGACLRTLRHKIRLANGATSLAQLLASFRRRPCDDVLYEKVVACLEQLCGLVKSGKRRNGLAEGYGKWDKRKVDAALWKAEEPPEDSALLNAPPAVFAPIVGLVGKLRSLKKTVREAAGFVNWLRYRRRQLRLEGLAPGVSHLVAAGKVEEAALLLEERAAPGALPALLGLQPKEKEYPGVEALLGGDLGADLGAELDSVPPGALSSASACRLRGGEPHRLGAAEAQLARIKTTEGSREQTRLLLSDAGKLPRGAPPQALRLQLVPDLLRVENILERLSAEGEWKFSTQRVKPALRQMGARAVDDDVRLRLPALLLPKRSEEVCGKEAALAGDVTKVAKSWTPPLLHPILGKATPIPHKGPHVANGSQLGAPRLLDWRCRADTRLSVEEQAQMETLQQVITPGTLEVSRMGTLKKEILRQVAYLTQVGGHLVGGYGLSPLCENHDPKEPAMWCGCAVPTQRRYQTLLRARWHTDAAYAALPAWRFSTEGKRQHGGKKQRLDAAYSRTPPACGRPHQWSAEAGAFVDGLGVQASPLLRFEKVGAAYYCAGTTLSVAPPCAPPGRSLVTRKRASPFDLQCLFPKKRAVLDGVLETARVSVDVVGHCQRSLWCAHCGLPSRGERCGHCDFPLVPWQCAHCQGNEHLAVTSTLGQDDWLCKKCLATSTGPPGSAAPPHRALSPHCALLRLEAVHPAVNAATGLAADGEHVDVPQDQPKAPAPADLNGAALKTPTPNQLSTLPIEDVLYFPKSAEAALGTGKLFKESCLLQNLVAAASLMQHDPTPAKASHSPQGDIATIKM